MSASPQKTASGPWTIKTILKKDGGSAHLKIGPRGPQKSVITTQVWLDLTIFGKKILCVQKHENHKQIIYVHVFSVYIAGGSCLRLSNCIETNF